MPSPARARGWWKRWKRCPLGTPARGWVTAMLYLPGLGSYDRYELRLSAERAGNGTVRLMPGSHD